MEYYSGGCFWSLKKISYTHFSFFFFFAEFFRKWLRSESELLEHVKKNELSGCQGEESANSLTLPEHPISNTRSTSFCLLWHSFKSYTVPEGFQPEAADKNFLDAKI